MIYLQLFLTFLKIGAFTFGGGYAMIPLIRESVLSYGWMSEEQILNFIAVAESTPGPIAVNMATFVGSSQGGILGAALATLVVVLPAFVIILLVIKVMERFMQNTWVKAAMNGLKPCVMGIILATGAYMVADHCLPQGSFDLRAFLVSVALAASLLAAKLLKKKLSPIVLILIGAVAGIFVYGF